MCFGPAVLVASCGDEESGTPTPSEGEGSGAVDDQSLALVGSIHGSDREYGVQEIQGGVDLWMAAFQHAEFTDLPYEDRPVWHLKTHHMVPTEAYMAEIRYVKALGFRVISSLMLYDEERLTDPAQRPIMLQTIEDHIAALCDADACPDVFSVDNEPDIPAPQSVAFWESYEPTLDVIVEGLIAAKQTHGVQIALPCIGLFGQWELFGSHALAMVGDRISEFDVWLWHVYEHAPGLQVVYDLQQIARDKTGNPNIEVVAAETAINFIGSGGDPEGKPWVQNEHGAVYFAAQVASSLVTGIKPCHFLLINTNTGIVRRPEAEQTLRSEVVRWLAETLFAPGFMINNGQSTVTLDGFRIVTSDGTHDRTLVGRFLPRVLQQSVRRALSMNHPNLTREEIEGLTDIEAEAAAVEENFETRPIPARGDGITVLHEMSHEDDDGRISWFVIEESATGE